MGLDGPKESCVRWDSRGTRTEGRCHGHRVKLSEENIVEIECLRVVAMLCENDSDYRQLVMEGSLSGRPTECRYCRYLAHRGRCHGNHFLAFCIWGVRWRHLANTTEPSVCGSDASLCQITLTTCYIGSRLSDHYFRSVCWFVCLSVCLFVCAEFFSAVVDPISIKLGHIMSGSICVP